VHLESDQPSRSAVRRVVINRGGHQTPVQNVRERIPSGDDMQLIPIVDLDQSLEVVAAAKGADGLLFTLLQKCYLAAQGEESPPALLVKLPRVGVLEIDVGLVTINLFTSQSGYRFRTTY
jgi:hypothetical protein